MVYLDPALARRAAFVRKQITQLPSKMRFVAAQFNALLHDELWIRLAEHANAMSDRLYDASGRPPGRGLRRSAAGQQPVPGPAAERHRAAAEWCWF